MVGHPFLPQVFVPLDLKGQEEGVVIEAWVGVMGQEMWPRDAAAHE